MRQISAISSAVTGLSSSFFCIWMSISPWFFSMIRAEPSSNLMSSLENGVSSIERTSPLSAE
jgi:hypothetical protein